MRTKVTDEQILKLYAEHGSVQKVGAIVGLNHSSVHERLVKLGANRPPNLFTDEDKTRLCREYQLFRGSGRLRDLANEMGRTVQFLSRQARELGLTDPHALKPGSSTWKHISESGARLMLEDFRRSRLGLGRYCGKKGYDDLGFARAMQRFFPGDWDALMEAKVPKTSKYAIGRNFEYRVRDALKKHGYFVMRSPMSRSPVDLIAVRKSQPVLMVQCKLGGQFGRTEWNELYDLAVSVGAVPILAMMPGTSGIAYYEMTDRKDGSKKPQPMKSWAASGTL